MWVRGPVSRDGSSLGHSLSFGGCISFLWLPLQTWGAEHTDSYSLPGVEVGSLKARCWRGLSLLEVLSGRSSQASLPAAGGYWQSLCSLACSCVTPISASVAMWPFPCVSPGLNFSLLIKIQVMGLGSTLVQNGFISTCLHLQRPYVQIRSPAEAVRT